MITEYIEAALAKARYEIIDDEEPYYGEVPELQGVWATGKTLEECRHNLKEVIEDWILLSIAKGLPIPALGEVSIRLPKKVTTASRNSAFNHSESAPERDQRRSLRWILKQAGISREEWLKQQS